MLNYLLIASSRLAKARPQKEIEVFIELRNKGNARRCGEMSTDQPAGEMSPVAPGKHLPSWALKFRQQVEAARVNIEATNKQISRVKASAEVLTGILRDTHAKFEARDKQNEEDKASKARDSRRLGEMRYFQLSKMLPDVF